MIEAYCRKCNKIVEPIEERHPIVGGMVMRWNYLIMGCGHILDGETGIMLTVEEFKAKTGWNKGIYWVDPRWDC